MESEPNTISVITAVLWAGAAAVGGVGLGVGYPRAGVVVGALPLVETTQMVTLTPVAASEEKTLPPLQMGAPSEAAADAPPAAPALPMLAATPDVTPVAAPSAAIAFAVPTEGLTKLVELAQAAHGGTARPAGMGDGVAQGVAGGTSRGPTPSAVATPPATPTRLTFGEGEGRQPAPEYPREAVLANEQGSVTLRFAVGADGRPSDVQIISGSRWPALNQAARRVIKDQWRFAVGTVRSFDITIQFQLE